MEVFCIPTGDRVIVYRPLRQLAFVGNQAMAELAEKLAAAGEEPGSGPPEALHFLSDIGFLEPDPPPPPAPDHRAPATTAVLLLTNRCSLRCIYCYADAGAAPAEDLPWEAAQAVMDQACAEARRAGREKFELAFHGGGEPALAWPLVEQATAHARAQSLPCFISLTSNGLWSDVQTEWIMAHLDGLTVSMDGSPATQDRQRPLPAGQGSSAWVLRTLARLDAAGKDYAIRLTALAPFAEALPRDVEYLCTHTRCRTMQVEPAFYRGRGERRQPTEEEAAAFAEGFLAAFEIARQAGRELIYSGARPWLLTQAFCTAPYEALIVTPAGRLVSCYEVTHPDHPLAALSAAGRVEGASVQVDQAARETLLGRIDERRALCHSCFCRWHCAGDCYTRAFGEDGSATEFSARCTINRTITQGLLLWYVAAGDGIWRGMNGPAAPDVCFRP